VDILQICVPISVGSALDAAIGPGANPPSARAHPLIVSNSRRPIIVRPDLLASMREPLERAPSPAAGARSLEQPIDSGAAISVVALGRGRGAFGWARGTLRGDGRTLGRDRGSLGRWRHVHPRRRRRATLGRRR
jgi:hypothetical protein